MTRYRVRGTNAVRLRVVALPAGDGGDKRDQVGRIHLRVAVHDAGHVDGLGDRVAVARDDGRADAPVSCALYHLDAWIDALRPRNGRVRGGVVHDEDPVDEVGNPANRLGEQPFLVVRRNDDGDCLALEQRFSPIPLRDLLQDRLARRLRPLRNAHALGLYQVG